MMRTGEAFLNSYLYLLGLPPITPELITPWRAYGSGAEDNRVHPYDVYIYIYIYVYM